MVVCLGFGKYYSDALSYTTTGANPAAGRRRRRQIIISLDFSLVYLHNSYIWKWFVFVAVCDDDDVVVSGGENFSTYSGDFRNIV